MNLSSRSDLVAQNRPMQRIFQSFEMRPQGADGGPPWAVYVDGQPIGDDVTHIDLSVAVGQSPTLRLRRTGEARLGNGVIEYG